MSRPSTSRLASVSLSFLPSFLGVLAFALASAATVFAQIRDAKVTGGAVEGVLESGITSFKGIPFAAPPIGDLRWKAPQPVVPWSDVRKADAFGPSPMQDAFWAALMGSAAKIGEDCLYLNVWTPAKSADEKRPVMVWIYGGGFTSGMTSAKLYDGMKLAQKGVVLVSIAYRVGAFGFLAHPELSAESGHGSGCYGLQDQIAGLKWVQDNIRSFGGDPDNVTIFGESAGGMSVCMLTTVPAAKGLFARAISQSGGSMAPVKEANEAGRLVPSLKLAENTGKQFLEHLGARDLESARALSAEAIQKGAAGTGRFWPVADGATLRGDQYELYLAGDYHGTPVLVGWNSDDGALFVHEQATPTSFEKETRTRFAATADVILAAYPHSTDAEASKSLKDLFRESVFAWPTWAWATLHSRTSKAPAYVYYYDHRIPDFPDGANHAAEIGYVFGNLDGWGGGSRPEDLSLAELMSSYWINFATTGDPNGPGLPAWPVFDEKDQKTMVFDKSPSARPVPDLDKLTSFDRYFAEQRKQVKASAAN